jgi:DNA-binding CsgD family transcriptional regulator
MTMIEAAKPLTPREHEIAALASSGLSNKQIAQLVGLTEGNVKQHLHGAFTKLGIQRRAI